MLESIGQIAVNVKDTARARAFYRDVAAAFAVAHPERVEKLVLNTAGGLTSYPEVMKAIREKTGLSQSQFALLIGVSLKTLQNWEQGRRHPVGGRSRRSAGAYGPGHNQARLENQPVACGSWARP